MPDFNVVTQSDINFETLLGQVGIEKVREVPGAKNTFGRSALIKSDGTFYELRFGQDLLNRLSIDWQSFVSLTPEVRQIIFDAISDMGRMGPRILRYRAEYFKEHFKEHLEKEESIEVKLEDFLNDEQSDDELES